MNESPIFSRFFVTSLSEEKNEANENNFSRMAEEKAVSNVEQLSTTQWVVVYSYIHHRSYGSIPINYRKREFMDSMPRKKVKRFTQEDFR